MVLMRPRRLGFICVFCLDMREALPPKASASHYLATGIVNSAPFAILSGQRCMMLL